MSHGDTILKAPNNFKITPVQKMLRLQALKLLVRKHMEFNSIPEVYHTKEGAKLLKNFLVDICGMFSKLDTRFIYRINNFFAKEKLGNDKVVLGLSGALTHQLPLCYLTMQ